MLTRLAHHGPDDAGSAETGRHWLGHRRLSIVDVAGGKQPLVNAAGNLFLVGNIDRTPRTREEMAYYRIFAAALPGIKPRETIGRWVSV